MLSHFDNCYTPDEIKLRYRQLAKTMHPDTGGSKEAFQDLQQQYEQALGRAQSVPKLPPLFHVDGHYTYFSRRVTYYQRDGHYYKFRQGNGADIWIDALHTHLIRTVSVAAVA